MNVQGYRERLLDMRSELAARVQRDTGRVRQQVVDYATDAGDASVADEAASESVTEAERDSTVLEQVNDALRRIDEGTFGACVVDGAPIEPQRLDAVPWTPYCAKHQRLRETAASTKTPTL